ILHNGTAGLLDLNVNQAQRALSSNVVNFNLNEHSFFGISASPKSNQSLEALEQIIQAQIQKLQQGDFPDWLIKAVITDLKLKNTKNLEQNSSRAYGVLNAFINGVPWINEVNYLKRLEQLNKSDIMRFANLYLKDSLAVRVYKHTGTDSSVKSVVKPSITPVGVNRNTESEFVKHLKLKKPETEIQPSFINFSTAVSSGTFAPGISYMYQKNNDNELFECYIRLKMGSQQNTMLPVAIQYIPFLGTSKQSPQAIKEELYRLGCTINVFNDAEQTWINLSGLKDGFIPAFEILIEMLQHPKINPQKLKNLIEDILKNRADAKLDKRILLNRALMNYVLYGADNPFTHQLSNDALKNIQPQQLEA
ncbi:MAG: insulinase family protein, partial [Bacteroidia bacterium]